MKGLADESELADDDLEFIGPSTNSPPTAGTATLLRGAEAKRVYELYRALGG